MEIEKQMSEIANDAHLLGQGNKLSNIETYLGAIAIKLCKIENKIDEVLKYVQTPLDIGSF